MAIESVSGGFQPVPPSSAPVAQRTEQPAQATAISQEREQAQQQQLETEARREPEPGQRVGTIINTQA